MRFIFLLILILVGLSSGTAFCVFATEQKQSGDHDNIGDVNTTAIDFSRLKRTHSGRVDQVIDALTFTLKDGKIIRLAALDIPGFVFPEPSEISLKAQEKLKSLLTPGTEIQLFQGINPKKGRSNRMGHLTGHVKIKDGAWIQGVLLQEGLARIDPSPLFPEMIDTMRPFEDKAREDTVMLWAEDAFPVLSHTDAGQAEGTFAVIEGRVVKAANVRNDLYLNFGANWKTDFTIQINTTIRKALVRNGIDPLALNDQAIRVRGWVRDYNGPLIELADPAALEILQPVSDTIDTTKANTK